MSPLRLLLWPFAFALSAYRSWRSEPAVHYPLALDCIGATTDGTRKSYYADKVTCPRCRAWIAEELLVTPEDIAAGQRGGLD